MPADAEAAAYDGTWHDAPDGDFAYALCNTAPPPPPPQPPIRPLKSEANNMSTDDDDGSTIIVALVVVLAVVALAVALAIGVAVFVWKKKKRSEPPVGAVVVANPVAVNVEMQTPGQGPSSAVVNAVSVEMPKAASGKKSVSLKLKELGLEQYASALIDDQGYDSMTTLQGLTKEEAGAIADEIKMKPGHKRRFVEGITK